MDPGLLFGGSNKKGLEKGNALPRSTLPMEPPSGFEPLLLITSKLVHGGDHLIWTK